VRFDEDIRGIEMRLNVRANGAKSVETFGAGELGFVLLNVARSDIVEAGIAEKVGQRIIGIADVRTAAADNESKLAFMLDALGIGRKHDRLVRADNGRRRLKKDKRLFGDYVAKFGGMSGVVAAYANDFAGLHGRE
jgi:hypothetical protein